MTARGKTLAALVLALTVAFLAGYLCRRARVPSIEEETERAVEKLKDSWRKLTK